MRYQLIARSMHLASPLLRLQMLQRGQTSAMNERFVKQQSRSDIAVDAKAGFPRLLPRHVDDIITAHFTIALVSLFPHPRSFSKLPANGAGGNRKLSLAGLRHSSFPAGDDPSPKHKVTVATLFSLHPIRSVAPCPRVCAQPAPQYGIPNPSRCHGQVSALLSQIEAR
jgi:hypothetical protein